MRRHPSKVTIAAFVTVTITAYTCTRTCIASDEHTSILPLKKQKSSKHPNKKGESTILIRDLFNERNINSNSKNAPSSTCIDEPNWIEPNTNRTCAHYTNNPIDCNNTSSPLSFSSTTTYNNNTTKTANEACCACGGIGCEDTPHDWLDILGDPCSWYEDNDAPGCPYYGTEPGSDGLSAQEVCCYCRSGLGSGSGEPGSDDDDAIFLDDNTDDEVMCAGNNIANDDVITTTTPHPDCMDSPSNWVDEFGDGCEYLEANDDFGCPKFGCIVGTDGIRAYQACCWCGGGEVMVSSSGPSSSSTPTVVPSVSVSPSVSVPSIAPSSIDVDVDVGIPSKADPIISTTATSAKPHITTSANMPVVASAADGLCVQGSSSSIVMICILVSSGAGWMFFVSSY